MKKPVFAATSVISTPDAALATVLALDICICPEVYRHVPLQRFDVIVFRSLDEDANYLKRVIGLPGDVVLIYLGEVAVASKHGSGVLEESYLGVNARGRTLVPALHFLQR